MAIGKPHIYRPDVDNLIKFIGDALNEVLWIDDALIYEIHVRKIYSLTPKTRICVEPHDGQELLNLLPQ